MAGQLGSALAAAWATRGAQGTDVRLELLDPNMGPIREATTVTGHPVRRPCGPGCTTFTLAGHPSAVTVTARERGRPYAVRLPLRWETGQSAVARRLLARAVASMASLRGVRDDERLTAGPPGPVETIHYRFRAPDRMAYVTDSGQRVTVIGGSEWSHAPGRRWSRSAYGSGAFTTRSWYDWAHYDQSVQLLDQRRIHGHATAEIALMSPSLPVWFRLRVDASTGRVSRLSMIAGGHFMTDRYSEYGAAPRIRAPTR